MIDRHPLGAVVCAFLLSVLFPAAGAAQWTNRYPKVDGYSHHVYLEGFELPILTNGPIDPAPAPDGRHVAFSSRGWIWIMDLETRKARRLTSGGAMDFRPAWHPDGERLAFVRDNDHDTRIVVVDVESGAELFTIDTPAIDIDPAYSADGETLFYTSGEAGDLDVWSVLTSTGERTRVTVDQAIELRPQPHPDGQSFVVLTKGIDQDRVELRGLTGGEEARVLLRGSIISMTRPALSPDGSTLAVNWPTQSGWELRLHSLADPGPAILLTTGLPLTPAWSPDGEWIYFSEADADQRMLLRRVRAAGGPDEELEVADWDYGQETGRLRIVTRMSGEDGYAPVRLNVVDEAGHPALPDLTAVHSDGQNGRVFFYSPGILEVTVPVGSVSVSAVQGLATPEQSVTAQVSAGRTTEVELELVRVWDAREAGWTSGDHHFHLNYGGPYDLDPLALVPKMAGEALDMGTPLLANLHNRFEDQELWGWEKSGDSPRIRFGQEVRSHFLGHLGLIQTPEFHWPWVWGPGYQVYGTDDRTNGEVLAFSEGQGGFAYYVHPIMSKAPFEAANLSSGPVELVADAVLGDVDALELVCLWSDEEGTAAMWHRFLNLGVQVVPSSGTDVMTDYYRTMAVGSTRVYAQTGDQLNWPSYMQALRNGESFVTNGPLVDFQVGRVGPGGVVPPGAAEWSLEVGTATEVETVEVLVNGRVVWTGAGPSAPGIRSYSGSVDLPEGGWVAVRATGGEVRWPSMDSYPYAHTAPVWIASRGSTSPEAQAAAATDLLRVLLAQRQRLIVGFGDADIPKLLARFDEAEEKLRALGGTG